MKHLKHFIRWPSRPSAVLPVECIRGFFSAAWSRTRPRFPETTSSRWMGYLFESSELYVSLTCFLISCLHSFEIASPASALRYGSQREEERILNMSGLWIWAIRHQLSKGRYFESFHIAPEICLFSWRLLAILYTNVCKFHRKRQTFLPFFEIWQISMTASIEPPSPSTSVCLISSAQLWSHRVHRQGRLGAIELAFCDRRLAARAERISGKVLQRGIYLQSEIPWKTCRCASHENWSMTMKLINLRQISRRCVSARDFLSALIQLLRWYEEIETTLM